MSVDWGGQDQDLVDLVVATASQLSIYSDEDLQTIADVLVPVMEGMVGLAATLEEYQ